GPARLREAPRHPRRAHQAARGRPRQSARRLPARNRCSDQCGRPGGEIGDGVKRSLPVILVVAVGVAAVAGGIQYSAIRADLSAQRDTIAAQWMQVDLAIEHRANLAPEWLRMAAGTPEIAGLEKQLAAGRADLAAAVSPEQKVRANQQIAV